MSVNVVPQPSQTANSATGADQAEPKERGSGNDPTSRWRAEGFASFPRTAMFQEAEGPTSVRLPPPRR